MVIKTNGSLCRPPPHPSMLGSKLKSEKSPKLKRKSKRKHLVVKKEEKELFTLLAVQNTHDSMSRENQLVKNE